MKTTVFFATNKAAIRYSRPPFFVEDPTRKADILLDQVKTTVLFKINQPEQRLLYSHNVSTKAAEGQNEGGSREKE